MKNRVVKKVERKMLVDKLCELQREICEHERFLGDMLIMLCSPRTENRQFIKHGTANCDYFEPVWDRVVALVKENEKMARELQGEGKKKSDGFEY